MTSVSRAAVEAIIRKNRGGSTGWRETEMLAELASLPSIDQALTDPENQPSQWGTIPLSMLPPARDVSSDWGFEPDARYYGWNEYRDALLRTPLIAPSIEHKGEVACWRAMGAFAGSWQDGTLSPKIRADIEANGYTIEEAYKSTPPVEPERRAERVDAAMIDRGAKALARLEFPDTFEELVAPNRMRWMRCREEAKAVLEAALTEQGAAGRGESGE